MMEYKGYTLMNIKMQGKEDFIKDNGVKAWVKEMVLVFNYGQMAQNMRECGKETKPMAKVE